MSDTLTKPSVETNLSLEIIPYEETDDPTKRTHIVNPPNNQHIWEPGMSARDIVNIARLLNKHVVALCGYRFVPKHDPEAFEACEKCMSIAGELMRGFDK